MPGSAPAPPSAAGDPVAGGSGGSQDLPGTAAALGDMALRVLAKVSRRGLTVATAESCTGGLLASLLTDQEGFGECFDRGFVTYTDEAKAEMLGVSHADITRYGAVSSEVGRAMARGALARSHAGIALSITGFAGPAGPHDEEGLVYLVAARRAGREITRECHFGSLERDRIRSLAARAALEMIEELADAIAR